MQACCVEIQQKIDAGSLVLDGNPWLLAPCPARAAEAIHTQQAQLRAGGISAWKALQLALQPGLFIWMPEMLGQNINVLCPQCGKPGKRAEWSSPRILHGLSRVSFYLTCYYTCNICECSRADACRGRKRKKFLADSLGVRSKLPRHIAAMYEVYDTGRTLCEMDVIDYIRAMATKASWSAIAESLNEMKATAWIRSVNIRYRTICTKFSLQPVMGWPASLPCEYLLSDQWVRNAYVRDAELRQPEVREELQAIASQQILAVDWTKDAAKRSKATWLLNVMDSTQRILGFKFTSSCKPYEAKALMLELASRRTCPKVIYVDDECCGAWREIVKNIWPQACVRLDPMHALRRLTQTSSSTNHPEHAGFCAALSKALYEWDQNELRRLQAARARDGEPVDMPQAALAKLVPRRICNPARIVPAIENVLALYACRKHAVYGCLLTPATHEAWKSLKQHVIAGCLCDVDGVDLHHRTDKELVYGGETFCVLQSRRGSSALEGFHTHQKQWLGSLATHSTKAGTLLLTDGALRWNRKRSRDAAASTASLVLAGGLLQEAGLAA